MSKQDKKEFYFSAGASFAHKLKVMSKSEANIRTKETLETVIEDRRTKVPQEYLADFESGLKSV